MADDKLENEYKVLDVIGSSGLNQQAGQVSEEWLRQLEGEKGVKIYTEMKDNDPVIGAILYAIKTLVRQTRMSIEPGGETEEHAFLANFVEECIEDTDLTWPDFMSEVLSMLPYGWSYFEILYKLRQGYNETHSKSSKYRDGRIGWRKFAVRSQDTLFKWEFDEEGQCLGFWQMAPPNYKTCFIPIEKSLLFRTETHKNNPEGRSILRNAFRSWFFMKRIQEIEAIGIERDLAGLPVMQVPVELLASNASSNQKAVVDDFRDMIQKIRRDEYEGIVIPSEQDMDGNPTGFSLSLLSSGGRRPIDVNEIVKRYESRVALSVLGEFVLLGMDTTGSFALSSNKTALFAQALGTYLQTIAATFNEQAIPRLMRLNGFTDASLYPKLRFADIETPDVAELAGALTQLVGAGVITPDEELEKYAREFANLPTVQSGTEMAEEPPEGEVMADMYGMPGKQEEDDASSQAINKDMDDGRVKSLMSIIESVACGNMPRDAAVELIVTAYGVERDKAERLLGSAGTQDSTDEQAEAKEPSNED